MDRETPTKKQTLSSRGETGFWGGGNGKLLVESVVRGVFRKGLVGRAFGLTQGDRQP